MQKLNKKNRDENRLNRYAVKILSLFLMAHNFNIKNSVQS